MGVILMSRELREAGIYVSALHPGHVRTDMGGPGGALSAEESIAGSLKVILAASEQTHGKLVNWEGQIIPY